MNRMRVSPAAGRVGIVAAAVILVALKWFGTIRATLTERAAAEASIERALPDGRVVELWRNRLPDGGYVTLYTDITERRVSTNALREANALAEAATRSMLRFVAMVSHEIRTPLSALLCAFQ